MLKEKGYDEFLEQKIQKARQSIQSGHYVTLGQAKKNIEAKLESKAKELAQYEKE